MKTTNTTLIALATVLVLAGQANAELWAVAGPLSSSGTAPAIIAAPAAVLDDSVTNRGMQGFDEAQGVLTTVAHAIDGGGSIPIGTLVDSHMIFLNSSGTGALSHFDVVWTFSRPVIGVMSDSGGNLEVASTFELGNPATNYTTTFTGSGPAAPFTARGMEGNTTPSGPFPNDGYTILGNTLTVGMSVTEPGDRIRVVTSGPVVPVPGAFVLAMVGLCVAGAKLRKYA